MVNTNLSYTTSTKLLIKETNALNIYDILMSPLEKYILNSIRKKLIPNTYGKVLEIGAGTGVNLKYYNTKKLSNLILLDKHINKNIFKKISFKLNIVQGTATEMPFADNTFDTIVETLVLCSVDNVALTLKEIKRVLKPSGSFIFVEHVLPESQPLCTLFKTLNPYWIHLAHGCNLTRKSHQSIEKAGFSIIELNSKGFAKVFRFGIAKKNSTL